MGLGPFLGWGWGWGLRAIYYIGKDLHERDKLVIRSMRIVGSCSWIADQVPISINVCGFSLPRLMRPKARVVKAIPVVVYI